jgi:8-oxo-dGTP diphosphatase
MPQQFELNSNISVDCVIFGFDGEKLNVLLIEEKDIGQGMLRKRLPGDLILKNESLDDAADRVLYELATLRNVTLKQCHTFGDPGRVNDPKDRKWLELYRKDPSERVITTAYYALVKMDDFVPNPASFAGEALWCDIEKFQNWPLITTRLLRSRCGNCSDTFELNKSGYELLPTEVYP